MIAEGEGLTVEFKEQYTTKIDRDMVAFANTKGGYILLGVADDGRITGQKLTNKLKAEIHSLARNCDPAISLAMVQIDNIVAVEISAGDQKPYSCSSGYFRRLDAVTQKMNHHEIKLFFQNEHRVPYEARTVSDISWDAISVEKIQAFFKEAAVNSGKITPPAVLSSLNLTQGDKITNAGILFFARNPRKHILQCQMTLAAFKGVGRVDIYDRKEVQDDLLTQFNEAIVFLLKHLNVRSEIRGVNRRDICEIPLEALREAVANAIIHRDYSMTGTSLMVEVHSDRVVISNPGGLPTGLTLRTMQNISVRRNELIADIFSRMRKVERMGTGIQRMREEMKKAGLQYPKIKTGLFYAITFFRPQAGGLAQKSSEKGSEKGSEKSSEKSSEKVLAAIRQDRTITAEKLSKKLNISSRAVEKQISRLKAEHKLKRVGPHRGGHWEVVD